MHQSETKPVEPKVFVEKTRQELDDILEKHGPIWATKLKNFIEIQEGSAFRHGFFVGSLFSGVVVFVILLVTRAG